VDLGIAPCAGGTLRWWDSDGPLVPLRYFKQLRQHAQAVAASDPDHLELRAHDGRGTTPALPARIRRIPAITLGALDEHEHDVVPRSHQMADTLENLDAANLDIAVEAGLLLVEAIDAALGRGPQLAAARAG
jgi:hypothetical protein